MHGRSEQEPRLPKAACRPSQGLLVPAYLMFSRLPGLHVLVSPEERGQAAQELPPPSSTAKNVLGSTLPALHPTHCCPPHTLFSKSQEHTHTCTHTSQPLFHTAHLSSQGPPWSPPTPWLPGLEGTPRIIWLASPHSELPLGCLPQDPCQGFSIFLHTSKDRELTTSQDRLLFGLL